MLAQPSKRALSDRTAALALLCGLLAATSAFAQGTNSTLAEIAAYSGPARIAKLVAGRLQRRVADACMQFHGGIGYMEETWTARYFRDSRLLSIGGGADEVMLRILSRMGAFA